MLWVHTFSPGARCCVAFAIGGLITRSHEGGISGADGPRTSLNNPAPSGIGNLKRVDGKHGGHVWRREPG